MEGMVIIARKRSADPAQEHLREQKAIWNKSTTDLIAKIIAFKRGLNGRGDPRVGLPPSNIKEPLPAQVGAYLDGIATDYEALINGAERIMQEQEHYSQVRRKTQPKMAPTGVPQSQPANSNAFPLAAVDDGAADDGLEDEVPFCPECGQDMTYNDGYDAYGCTCGYIGPNSPGAVKTASWWGSRWWASNFAGKPEERPMIKNMLRSAVSMRHKMLDIENFLSSSDPNSIPRALAITSSFGIGPYKNILQFFDSFRKLHGRDLADPAPPKKDEPSKPLSTGTPGATPGSGSDPIQTMNYLVEIQKDLPNLQSVVNHYTTRDDVATPQKNSLKSLKGATSRGSDISIYINKLRQGLSLAPDEAKDAEKIILSYRKLLALVSQLMGFDSLNFADYAKKIQDTPIEATAGHIPIDHNPLSRFFKKKWLKHKPDLLRSDVDLDMRKQMTIDHLDAVIDSLEMFMDVLVAHSGIDEIFKSLKELSGLLAEVVEDIITLAEYHTSMYRDENRLKRKGVILEPIIEREINKLRKANIGIREMSSKILIHKPDYVIVPT